MVDTSIMTTSGSVLAKAGEQVSVSGSTIAKIDQFVAEAESFVNCAARYNWSDNYAAANADVKKILSEAVSNLAAIYIIDYDYRGYPSRIDAEDKINVLYQRAMDCIELIKDQNTETFIKGA